MWESESLRRLNGSLPISSVDDQNNYSLRAIYLETYIGRR